MSEHHPWAGSLGAHAPAVVARLRRWHAEDAVARLWAHDPTLWAPAGTPEITNRLGWLHLPRAMGPQAASWAAFADEVAARGTAHVVLLGMGGSSLAPEVFSRTFGSRRGRPRLMVLDSTHPGAIGAVDRGIDLARTLFLVSSKSGTTIEPLAFFHHFWEQAAAGPQPGRHFAAITDPGTPLASLAAERGFWRVFAAPPDVGGRFSALSPFGLVPAALLGIDPAGLLKRAAAMAEACRRPPADNPGLVLGAILGELALAGRDKATFLVSPSLAGFPAWAEQLVAESTGKAGIGILPVADEPAGPPAAYGFDRLFVHLSLASEDDPARAAVDRLESAGHPVVHLQLESTADLVAEMYRAEVAVAMAGSILGIHPFDQPDVQLAKELAAQAMAGKAEGEPIPSVAAADRAALAAALGALAGSARPGDYLALQAFIAPEPEAAAALEACRLAARDRLRLATTAGFGPRFLHSTGQFHKGGPDTGLFLQLVDTPGEDLPVPGSGHRFGDLVAAQADGDFRALSAKGRRVGRVNLGSDPPGGLRALAAALAG